MILASWFRFVVHASIGELIYYGIAAVFLLWFFCAVFYRWMRGRL